MSNSGGWRPSDIKPAGWFVIFLVVAAVFWFGIKPRLHAFTLGGLGGGAVPGGGSNQANIGQAQGADILVLTTGTKRAWLQDEIDKFNGQSQNGHVELDILESRDGMQKILAGAEKPDLWSPSSTVWTDRLAIIGPSKGISIHQGNDDMRTLFQSPLVFLVVKSQLSELRPILTGRHPFSRLGLSGKYKFGYADPLNASSGMLTMSVLLNEYADVHDVSDLTSVATSPAFASWLDKVDAGLVRQGTSGSSQLEASFEADPGDRSFITAYESSALQAVAKNPSLALLYPDPTADATQVAALVDGPWMTDVKRATVKEFLDFITSDDANNDALKYYFRPASNGGSLLGQKVTGTPASAYFKPDFRADDLPTYEAINDANVVWHNQAR